MSAGTHKRGPDEVPGAGGPFGDTSLLSVRMANAIAKNFVIWQEVVQR